MEKKKIISLERLGLFREELKKETDKEIKEAVEDVPKEIYVGDGDMPEDATIQIILNEEGSSSQDRFEEMVIDVLEATGLIQLVRADENTVYVDKNGSVLMF